MSSSTLDWKSFKATRWIKADALREFVGAMPIVILATALRDAWQGPLRARTSMLVPRAR